MCCDALRTEADLVFPSAASAFESVVELDPVYGTLRGPRTQRHATGAQLEGFHEGSMHALCSQLTGLDLYPTRCSYLFFDETSTLGLHQDVPACTYTATLYLRGVAPILQIVTDEAHTAPESLLGISTACAGHPDLGESIPLHKDTPLIFRGSRYAHRLFQLSGACIIAAFCYATLHSGEPA